MPTPRSGESRDSFLERCIPMLIEEGREQDQAVAICNSYWRDKKSSFTVYKTADGWRWVAIFSNKYRDNDNPPEILSESAHLDYVKAVDEGEWPYPELWLWHIPGTRWGEAELVAYDTAGGFSLAAGRVDKGKEAIAEALNSLPSDEVGVSHGWPTMETRRDETDPSIIVRYRSKEISPLPMENAANKLTSFSGVDTMKLQPQEAEERLQGWFGKEAWDKLKNLVDTKTKEATDAELEFKDTEETETPPEEVEEAKETEETPEEEAPEDTKAEEAPDEPGIAEAEEKSEPYSEEVKEAVLFLADQMREQQDIIKTLAERIVELESNLKEIAKSEEERIAEKAAWTPRASQPSLREIAQARVVGNEEARVDGRTKEAKDGPQEYKSPTNYSTNPAMNQAVSSIVEKWQHDMVLGPGLAPRND